MARIDGLGEWPHFPWGNGFLSGRRKASLRRRTAIPRGGILGVVDRVGILDRPGWACVDVVAEEAVLVTSESSDVEELPISVERVEGCLSSASYWAVVLPGYADRNQRWADFWAIVTGVVGAVTSLTVWPVLDGSSSTSAKLLISVGALATAICQLIPRVRNHAELATQAKELSSAYGALVGKLRDLEAAGVPQGPARSIIADYQTTKARKDALRRVPSRHLRGEPA